jgi:hypothetical protein
MSLLDVNNMYKEEQNEKFNMGKEDTTPVTIDNTNTIITGFCPNCNKKNNQMNKFCDKDCETTYMIEKNITEKQIPKLKEEILKLKEKQIPMDINFTSNYEKNEKKIQYNELLIDKLERELLLLKGKLPIEKFPPNAIAIPIVRKKAGGKKIKKTRRIIITKKNKYYKKRRYSRK